MKVQPEELWFNTPDSPSLCRGGGNGPQHPSQLYAIKKYVEPFKSFLDYGCGSATTYEALQKEEILVDYLGLDIIPKNVEWCKNNFPNGKFEINPSIHKIDQPDQSWDVVYSRHVVDHMNSFEEAMDEHLRVVKELVIVVLWVPFEEGDEHKISNIIDHRGTDHEVTYPNEYTNSYSRKKVMEWIKAKEPWWDLVELTEDVGSEVSGHDTVIVMRRKDSA